MIPNGIELFTLRQRRSPSGDTIFTGRFGNALVILVRDEVERDVWKAFACDPNQANARNDTPLRARAISAPAPDGWYQSNMDDELPDDLQTEEEIR